MAAMRGPRLQVGSAAWVAEERSSALQIVDSEVEEFSYSARNEMDWLNEHMAGIFDENETNFADTFKTPGKLRGKTPRTIRRPVAAAAAAAAEGRVPLSDVFSATPNIPTSHFSPRLNSIKSPQILRDVPTSSPEIRRSPSPRKLVDVSTYKQPLPDTQDSGYHGSQDMIQGSQSFRDGPGNLGFAALNATTHIPVKLSPAHAFHGDSPEKTFQTAKEEQTTRVLGEVASNELEVVNVLGITAAAQDIPESVASSPLENGLSDKESQPGNTEINAEDANGDSSPSEASSPIRPMVRKSSLNFASLPAREPLTAVKANGGRVSRVSHLEHNRMSYYSRPTGGKSLGNVTVHDHDSDEIDDNDEVVTDRVTSGTAQTKYEDLAANHHKTYTQRLQDQISMLGKSQPHVDRPAKPVPDGTSAHKVLSSTMQAAQTPKSPSPFPMTTLKSTPGAFPEDEDDWIEPPSAPEETAVAHSPRPVLPKSHSADIMEAIHQTAAVGETLSSLSSPQRQTVHETQPVVSSLEQPIPSNAPETSPMLAQALPLYRAATIANLPLEPASVLHAADTAPKSPARSYRDSPLKHLKNKMSSILKGSKVLIASSAALSAEGKSSILSPSMPRLGHFPGPSMESVAEKLCLSQEPLAKVASSVADTSPTRPTGKRTRASIEKEKEEKRRDKENKRMEEQLERLEKARAQEREKARDFSKEKEEAAQSHKTPKTTRTSPRKPRVLEENTAKHLEADVEMPDVSSTLPQPAPKSVGPASATRTRELKRPIKPVKETLSKSRQAPTVIRVNTGSQHSQYLTSNSTSSAAFTELDTSMQLPSSQPQLTSKASKASLQSKPSTQSLRAAASASRPKALDAAAKKKEQEEREAQKRREAKADIEKKRLAAQEEQRKVEQAKRQDAERQKQKEREQLAQTEAKKNAQRQAAIEKAKQTRAPPPAARSHAQAAQDFTPHQDKRASTLASMKAEGPRPPSRMNSGLTRSQDETGRPTTSHATKIGAKRTLPAETAEESYKSGSTRAGPSYQAKDAKRRRTSDEFDERQDGDNPPNIKGPPVRPSGGFKKDISTKPGYPTTYANAPSGATRDLFKATVTAQHHIQAKPAHPLDMAQISKGAIPFAPHASTATGHPTKTPVRTTGLNGMKASAARSAAKPSPKFQNGEAIELPEIQTDDEDDDEDDGGRGMVAAWADSPDLRQALLAQETLDPSQIFGPPRPLNMEEVFFKSQDKFKKFRNRTSSANWTGADRLTEDDIRKDLAARDKLRREGGWTYEMSKNLL